MTYQDYAGLPDGSFLIHRQGSVESTVWVGKSRARTGRGTVPVYIQNMRMWVKPASLALPQAAPEPEKVEAPKMRMAKAYQDMGHLRHRGYVPRWWVSEIPGDGGVDWGWTTDSRHALLLTPHWQREYIDYGGKCGWRSYGLMDPNTGQTLTQRATAQEHTEWLQHMADATRFGSKDPAKVADVLTYGKVSDGG